MVNSPLAEGMWEGSNHCSTGVMAKGLRKSRLVVEQESKENIREDIEAVEIFLMTDSKGFRGLGRTEIESD